MTDHVQSMIQQAVHALQYSYSPYSNFQVACTICSEDGSLFTGVNVENSSYGLTICAETSAIAQMISKGQKQIKQLVILSGNNQLCPPCGACRQQIFQFSTKETQIYLCDNRTVLQSLSMEALLPLAFSFKSPSGKKHD